MQQFNGKTYLNMGRPNFINQLLYADLCNWLINQFYLMEHFTLNIKGRFFNWSEWFRINFLFPAFSDLSVAVSY